MQLILSVPCPYACSLHQCVHSKGIMDSPCLKVAQDCWGRYPLEAFLCQWPPGRCQINIQIPLPFMWDSSHVFYVVFQNSPAGLIPSCPQKNLAWWWTIYLLPLCPISYTPGIHILVSHSASGVTPPMRGLKIITLAVGVMSEDPFIECLLGIFLQTSRHRRQYESFNLWIDFVNYKLLLQTGCKQARWNNIFAFCSVCISSI